MDWGLLKPQIYEKIENFYSSDLSLFDDSALPKDTLVKEDDSEAVALIKEILETKIRPNVQEDGGDIEFIDFDEATGVVYLEMKGACTDCPSSRKHLSPFKYLKFRDDSQERNRKTANSLCSRSHFR